MAVYGFCVFINLVHVSLYIILFFSVIEVVEIKMLRITCVCPSPPIAFVGFEGTPQKVSLLILVAEANKNYKGRASRL